MQTKKNNTKSPFFIVDEFISPLLCEDIVDRTFYEFPNKDNNISIKSVTQNILTQNRILPYIETLIPHLEVYYNFEHMGILPINIETYPVNCKQESVRSENSELNHKNEWNRVNDKDFTGIIFLKDSCEEKNFDDEFEVYGTKLEFPTHGFGFKPQRGQLIVFPSGPNFVNATISPVLGDMVQIRFNIVATKPFVYNMHEFPGNYNDWF